ncbi:hypothetical protein MMC28_011334 [Mycoblastus sanguinarius]|nr:hypothetical protein [Mycoblastus sanguinarius]
MGVPSPLKRLRSPFSVESSMAQSFAPPQHLDPSQNPRNIGSPMNLDNPQNIRPEIQQTTAKSPGPPELLKKEAVHGFPDKRGLIDYYYLSVPWLELNLRPAKDRRQDSSVFRKFSERKVTATMKSGAPALNKP